MEDAYRIRFIASGSSGNALFIEAAGTRLLIDAGIPLRRIEKALSELEVKLSDLDALLVTHEHSDHVKGLEALLSKVPDLPVHATAGTLRALGSTLAAAQTKKIKRDAPFTLGRLDVLPFATSHDAAEPVGFRFEGDTLALGFATDLGEWGQHTLEALKDVDILMLEANHDLDLLWRGPYPPFLKRRVAGPRGHLSNIQARDLLERVAHDDLQSVVLTHMSSTNNEGLLAEKLMLEVLSGVDCSLAVAQQKIAMPPLEPDARERRRPQKQMALL